ncbi:MerR family transcriptional regulator [Deminuibacter soli]|uniref:MerR family transcriptional regulator n=1 Tax=Deminuibacter soli TaxID=2291815 RepID=A0A3E1NHD2_9BACT|nr:MerR family transcriptional regulator [Deminuibacter soli]RFM27188.1 MerR family transcriptional regulator [Deminuibacter soli]
MHAFTIKDMENLSGIKAHTLRIWEQRYRLMIPKRGDSNHRVYDNEDLKQLLRISFLYHNGFKISHIARLQQDALKALALNQLQRKPFGSLQNQLLEAMIDFDDLSFSQALNYAMRQLGVEECMLQVVYPYLEKTGLFWLTNSAMPVQEHFASNIIRHRLLTEIDALPRATGSPQRYLLFTPPGEHHEIPLLFIYYMLKKAGKNVLYAGAGIDTDTLQLIAGRPVTHLFYYQITNFMKQQPEEYASRLCQDFSTQQVVAGGPVTRQITNRLPNLTVLNSLQSQLDYLRKV